MTPVPPAEQEADRISRIVHFQAAVAIYSRAFDGLIKARARLLIIGDNRSEDAVVPREFWWPTGHAALDQKWPTGDFETWIDRSIHCRAYGVEFLESDIDAMLPRQTPIRKVKPAGQGNLRTHTLDRRGRFVACGQRRKARQGRAWGGVAWCG